LQTIVQDALLKDNRSTHLIFQYGDLPSRPAGVYSLQPFFDYKVCFVYPLPGVEQGVPAETFAQALEVVWCPNGRNSNDGCVDSTYDSNQTKFAGELVIEGIHCNLWEYTHNSPPATVQKNRFCVDEHGALLSANLSFHGQQKLNNDTYNMSAFSENLFRNFSTEMQNASLFELPVLSECVDLRPMVNNNASSGSDTDDTPLNSMARIDRINTDAEGMWRAAPQAHLAGKTVGDMRGWAGLRMGALNLPLPSAAHVQRLGVGTIPAAFDARTHSPWKECTSIGAVRDQGRCGGCWAFGSTEAFQDRLCIACVQEWQDQSRDGDGSSKGGHHGSSKGGHRGCASEALSTEYMIDCDGRDNGCSGGMLDNAWGFLVSHGLPTEKCVPYLHYPGPPPPPPAPTCNLTSDIDWAPRNTSIMTIGIDSAEQCCERCASTPACVVGVYQPPGLCHLKADISGGMVQAKGYVSGALGPPRPKPKPSCPKTCKDGSAIQLVRAKNAYAVGAPGEVQAMQRELMAHGPFEVTLQIHRTAIAALILSIDTPPSRCTTLTLYYSRWVLKCSPISAATRTAPTYGLRVRWGRKEGMQ
jgi:hypothetical protein